MVVVEKSIASSRQTPITISVPNLFLDTLSLSTFSGSYQTHANPGRRRLCAPCKSAPTVLTAPGKSISSCRPRYPNWTPLWICTSNHPHMRNQTVEVNWGMSEIFSRRLRASDVFRPRRRRSLDPRTTKHTERKEDETIRIKGLEAIMI